MSARSKAGAAIGLATLLVTHAACKPPGECLPSVEAERDRWLPLCEALDADGFRDMTLLIGNADGIAFEYKRGNFTPAKQVEIASASKWLSSATIMRLVESGQLALGDHPQQYISWWTADAADERSQVTLEQLLSFTSGMALGPVDPSCINDADTDLEDCARQFYEGTFEHAPGTAFYYGPPHMHVAAVMAQEATGQPWRDLFREQLVQPLGLDPATAFVKASESNPRIAGGASTSAEDYARFLQALLDGSYLAGTFDVMRQDRTPGGTVELVSSPLEAADLDWHYCLGFWKECPEASYGSACEALQIYSSPGAYGWHPWLDLEHGYYAVLAVKRTVLVGPSKESVLLANQIRPFILDAL